MKENVIVGHLIPAGTGSREYQRMIVGSMEDYEKLVNVKRVSFEDEVLEEEKDK